MAAALPDYWTFGAHAPGASLTVAQAHEAVMAANKALLAALEHAYPLQALVRVIHSRGEFRAHVTGWDTNGTRVRVRNTLTGKTSKWWAAHVELVPVTSQAGAKEESNAGS